MIASAEKRIEDLLHLCKNDAYDFSVRLLGAEPTSQQEDVLRSISPEGAHVSIRSGHGCGKTSCLAWCILWFILTRKQCKVLCTAPTAHQLEDNLWGELHIWREKMPNILRRQVILKKNIACIKDYENLRYAVARTARPENPEALQGGHSPQLLLIIDEASGVPDVIFETAEGSLTSRGSRVLMTANPTKTTGYFYNSHHGDRANWDTKVFNCKHSPLVTPDFIEKMKKKYGEDSDWFRVRVLGEFPKGSPDTLIPLEWITSAVDRDIEYPVAKAVAGLDVARFGDDATAIVIRKGNFVAYIDQWYKNDLMNTCGKVKRLYDEKFFDIVQVDVIGLGGGVVDRLQELGVPCVGINVAEGSAYSDKFNRLRDELWWNAREFFESQNCKLEAKSATLPEYFSDFIAQLSMMTYGMTSSGKTKVKSKEEIKKGGKDSPNIADAFCLSLAQGFSGNMHRSGRREVVPVSFGAWQ